MYELLRIYGESGNIYADLDLPKYSETEPTMVRLTLEEWEEVYNLIEHFSKRDFPRGERVV